MPLGNSLLPNGFGLPEQAPLPALEGASILLPASARGPAFLVGANFRTILRYNNSTSYPLAVGLLVQQLSSSPAVQTAWPRDLLALQTALNARGFDSGAPDGTMGPATQRGVRQYQRSLGLPADGYPTPDRCGACSDAAPWQKFSSKGLNGTSGAKLPRLATMTCEAPDIFATEFIAACAYQPCARCLFDGEKPFAGENGCASAHCRAFFVHEPGTDQLGH